MKRIICLMGPTASGKTPLAIELVRRFPLEIISVDSAMVYRGLDIGTAKPSKEILQIAPHRLIDIRDPSEIYSAGQFVKDAQIAIDEIYSAQRIPLFVGGTMLYFNVLQKGIAQMPAPSAEIRASLQARAMQEGWTSLHEELSVIDPEAAARIKDSDGQRISRALEVFFQTGQTITAWQKQHTSSHDEFKFYNLVINISQRDLLHQRIKQRFDDMLAHGFMQEVRGLYDRGDLHADLPSIRSVGYRQAWQHLDGLISFNEMYEKALTATRQLAKRQMTWLRTFPSTQWFMSDEGDVVEEVGRSVEEILEPSSQ